MYPLSSPPKLKSTAGSVLVQRTFHISWAFSSLSWVWSRVTWSFISFDKSTFHFIIVPMCEEASCCPEQSTCFFTTLKKSELSTNLVVSSPPFVPWTPWSAPVPLSPAVGSCPFIPSFCPFLFNIVNAHRDPFLLSSDCLVFGSVFGEGLCQKLFRN